MRHSFRSWPAAAAIFAAAALLALVAVRPAAAASAAKPGAAATKSAASDKSAVPASDDDKLLYALGVLISHNLDAFQLSPAEFKQVQAGLVDGFYHRPGLDAESYVPKLQALQRERVAAIDEHQKQVGQAFLDKAAAVPGARKTASGLVFISEREGTGASPSRTDRVGVTYEGKLADGTVFDSSAKHGGQPVTFNLSGIIPCWTEALQLMKVGGKSRVVCPSSLAYGDRGQMPTIMPGAVLDFDVELVSILPKPSGPTPGEPAAPATPPTSGGAN